MPRVRRCRRAELVGLHVLGDGKAAEEVLGQVFGMLGMRLNAKRRSPAVFSAVKMPPRRQSIKDSIQDILPLRRDIFDRVFPVLPLFLTPVCTIF